MLDAFAEDWLTGRVRLADSTLEKSGELLYRHVLPELGPLPLTALRPCRLYDWQQHRLDAGAGPPSSAGVRDASIVGSRLRRSSCCGVGISNAKTCARPRSYPSSDSSTRRDVEAL